MSCAGFLWSGELTFATRWSGVVVSQGRGQLAVSIGLGEQESCLLLDRLHRVDAGDEAQRWLVLTGELDQRVGELGRVAALLAVHALPSSDGQRGAFGVVRDGGRRVLG